MRYAGNSGAKTATAAFRSSYAAAFRFFLDEHDETSLRLAYEVGRDAATSGVGLLEVAQVHHDVLRLELARSPEAAESTVEAAGGFLLEALSAYEMLRRGFAEARAMVASERTEAAMLRQLSTLLGDASLAVHGRASIEEVLQLVAEQTKELTGALWCVTYAEGFGRRPRHSVAHAGNVPVEPLELARDACAVVDAALPPIDDAATTRRSIGGDIVVARLAALDGRTLGIIAVGDAEQRFGELEQALLTHIGQMTSAALERATQYADTARSS